MRKAKTKYYLAPIKRFLKENYVKRISKNALIEIEKNLEEYTKLLAKRLNALAKKEKKKTIKREHVIKAIRDKFLMK